MEWLFWVIWVVGVLIFIGYGFVLPFGAPFLPTMAKPGKDALDMLGLKPGQTFVDLGCGDGRLLVLAAERGLKAIGYELNPFLAILAWIRTFKYRGRVKVRVGNFWRADLSEADGIFVFLLDRFMPRFDAMMEHYSKGRQLKVVSHAFKIPGKTPAKKRGAMMLYIYKGK